MGALTQGQGECLSKSYLPKDLRQLMSLLLTQPLPQPFASQGFRGAFTPALTQRRSARQAAKRSEIPSTGAPSFLAAAVSDLMGLRNPAAFQHSVNTLQRGFLITRAMMIF
jgi:hypothetical protein